MKLPLVALLIVCGGWCAMSPVRGQSSEPSPTPPSAPQDPGGRRPREFQGDDLGQVLRLLARQAKINLLVDEAIKGTVDVRLESASAMEAIEALARLYRLNMSKDEKGFYYLAPANPAETALDLLAKPATAARIAAFKHNLYEALLKEGFSSGDALQVMNESDLEVALNLLGKKPEPAPPK
ncbi:MAG: hypothetical protein INR65_16280 [Gluconacetobacter diazotrophicus]|nr:hypothetical protein [Gluconacetobacter diazotrophicus]